MEHSKPNNNNNGIEDNLFDMLTEDDCLLTQSSSSSSGNMVQFYAESSKSVHERDTKDTADMLENTDQAPQPLEPSKPERKVKSGKYNLRKSLAWDNAFFTSAGVLEPEELTCIIEGSEKDESSLLPQIEEEDVHKSTDSLSSLGGDSLECLEAGLFEDIRASIQRSSKASSTPSTTGKTKLGTIKAQTLQFSASKVDTGCRMKMKPKLTSGTDATNKRVLGKSAKQAFTTTRDSSSSLPKVPMAADKGASDSTTPSKRASLGANRFKAEKCNVKGAAKAEKCNVRPSRIATGVAPVSRIPPSMGPRSTLPRPTSNKASANYSTAKIERKNSSSSLDSSGSTFSGKTSDSPTVRRKIVSRVGNLPSSAATANKTSKAVSKDKLQPGNSQLSAYLKSMTKLSPSVSPASSISEWSSESSSSNVTAYQGSNSSRSSLDCRRASVDFNKSQTLDSRNYFSDQCLDGHVTKGSGLLGQDVKKTSMGIQPNPAKPTGLKMPSTKFGFFDGVKPVRTPKGSMKSQSAVPGGLPKIASVAANPSKGMIKENPGKSQPFKSASKNAKMGLPSATVKTKSPVTGDLLNSAREVSKNVKRSPSVSVNDQHKISPQSSGEVLFKAEEVGEHDIAKLNPNSSSAEHNLKLGVVNSKTSVDINNNLHTDGRQEIGVENTSPLEKRDAVITVIKQDPRDVPALLVNRDIEIQKESNGDSDLLCQSDDATKANSCNLEISCAESKQELKDVPASLGNMDREVWKEPDGDLSFLNHSDSATKANSCNLEKSCAKGKQEPKDLPATLGKEDMVISREVNNKRGDADIIDTKQDPKNVPTFFLGNKDMEIQKEANGDSDFFSQSESATKAISCNSEISCAESKEELKDVPASLCNMDREVSKEPNGDSSFLNHSDIATKANSCNSEISCAESKQELKDLEKQMANGNSSFRSPSDNAVKASSCNLEISCPGKLFSDHQEESLVCLSKVFASEPSFESAVDTRIPLAVKYSLYNVNGLPDTAKKPTEMITEKLVSCPPEGILKENGSDGATA